jgi:hypothetical protein
MTPNGQVTELQVWKMINDAIKDYDLGNAKRHEENTKKLDRLMWAILGTLLTAASGLAVNLIIHAVGK